MPFFTEAANAKINLSLEVRGKRADGYHEIESLVMFADVGDSVILDTSGPRGLKVTGPFAPSIEGENLAEVALERLVTAVPALRLGTVLLEKRLPVAAGMGGGSADAAAVLRAIRRANPEHEKSVEWLGIAKGLGADVPVCLVNRSALMYGIGDKVEPLQALPRIAAVLVNPCVPVPADKTAQVFRALAAAPAVTSQGAPARPGPFRDSRSLLSYLSSRRNALEAAATSVVPAITEVRGALAATEGCRLARLSGAGPTCFGLYDAGIEALRAARALARAHPGWWVRAAWLA